MFLTKLITCCGIAVALRQSSLVEARTLYVDNKLAGICPTGSYDVSARTCVGSQGWGSARFSDALSVAAPGDTIILRGGTYTAPLTINKSGTQSAHLQITAFKGEAPVIDLADRTNPSTSGITIDSQRFLEISGLRIQNAGIYGVKVSQSSDISFTDCEVAFSGHGGMVFEGGSNLWIRAVRVHHNNLLGLNSMHEGISLEGVNTFVVETSKVYDNGKEGIDAKYGSTNGRIEWNIVDHNNGPNIYLDGVSFISVVSNVCHDTANSQKAGVGIAVESASNPLRFSSHDLEIVNNVLYGNGAGVSIWLEAGALAWAKIYNVVISQNTIAMNNQSNWGGIFCMNGTGNFGTGNAIRNNLFWQNTSSGGAKSIRDDAGVMKKFNVDGNVFDAMGSSSSFGTNYGFLSSDPFKGSANGDFHLSAGVPMVLVNASNVISEDLDGKLRPQSGASAGAYERN